MIKVKILQIEAFREKVLKSTWLKSGNVNYYMYVLIV